MFTAELDESRRATLRALIGAVFCDENEVRAGWNHLSWDIQVLCTGDDVDGWTLTAHRVTTDPRRVATSDAWIEEELAAALREIGVTPR